MEKNPDNQELMADLAQTFYELGLHAETLQMCKTILKNDRDNWRISLLSKCARHWIHEHNDIMNEILQCSPASEDLVYKDLNSVLSLTCNVQEAIAMLHYYADRAPAERVYYLMAVLLKIEGRPEEARTALDAAHNDSPEAQALRGSLADSEGTHILSEEEMAARSSRSPEEWLITGLELMRQREFQLALQAFQNTLNGNPKSAAPGFLQGRYLNTWITTVIQKNITTTSSENSLNRPDSTEKCSPTTPRPWNRKPLRSFIKGGSGCSPLITGPGLTISSF